MALEDAAVLFRCITLTDGNDPQNAFRLYEATRAPRTRHVQLEFKKGDWQRYSMDHKWVLGYDAFTVPLVESASTVPG